MRRIPIDKMPNTFAVAERSWRLSDFETTHAKANKNGEQPDQTEVTRRGRGRR
jgi:hypothetical protein